MHDIRAIRDDGDAFAAALSRRPGVDGKAVVAEVKKLDEALRAAQTVKQDAETARNTKSKEIGKAKAQKDDALAETLMAEVAAAKETIEKQGAEEDRIRGELDALLAGLPNLPLASVPDGADEECNVVQRVWDKGEQGTVGDLEAGYGVNYEFILYATKGRRALNGRPRSILRQMWSGTMDPAHPTVKPVVLLEKLILASTDAGELVLDPFAGSCTTLRAAANLGRQSIGIEIEERWSTAGIERMRQLNLF